MDFKTELTFLKQFKYHYPVAVPTIDQYDHEGALYVKLLTSGAMSQNFSRECFNNSTRSCSSHFQLEFSEKTASMRADIQYWDPRTRQEFPIWHTTAISKYIPPPPPIEPIREETGFFAFKGTNNCVI